MSTALPCASVTSLCSLNMSPPTSVALADKALVAVRWQQSEGG
jgi:hypothetical protein